MGVTHGAVDDGFVVAGDGAAAVGGGAVVENDDLVAVAAAAVDGATAATGESVEASSCQSPHLQELHLQDHSVALTQHAPAAAAVAVASVAAVAAVLDDHSAAEENDDAAVVDAVAGPAQETDPEMKGEETGVGRPRPCWPPPQQQQPPAVEAVTATCHSAPDTSKDSPSKDQVSSEYTCTRAGSGPSPSASSRGAPSRPHPHPANSLSATTTFAGFERVFLFWTHHQPCLTVPLQLQQSQKPLWLSPAQSKTVPWPMQGQG